MMFVFCLCLATIVVCDFEFWCLFCVFSDFGRWSDFTTKDGKARSAASDRKAQVFANSLGSL